MTEQVQPPQSFDEMSQRVFDSMNAELGQPVPPADATATPPVVDGAQPAPPATPPVVDAWTPPRREDWEAQQRITNQLAAAVQAAIARPQQAIQQPQAAPQAREERRPPSTREALRDFEAPARPVNASDDDYRRITQEAVLDHVNGKTRSFYEEQARSFAREEIDRYRNELQAAQQQQSREQNVVKAIDKAVEDAGYKSGSEHANIIRQSVYSQLSLAAQRGLTNGWQDNQWLGAIKGSVDTYRKVIAPPVVPGAAPSLSVVQGGNVPSTPQLGGGGTSSVPGSPPQVTAAKPQSFDEMTQRVWETMQKESARR